MGKTRAINELKASWQEMVEFGVMSRRDMLETLCDQIDGINDISVDLLTEGMAEIMGWDYDTLMADEEFERDEWNTWVDVVVEAAQEFIQEMRLVG